MHICYSDSWKKWKFQNSYPREERNWGKIPDGRRATYGWNPNSFCRETPLTSYARLLPRNVIWSLFSLPPPLEEDSSILAVVYWFRNAFSLLSLPVDNNVLRNGYRHLCVCREMRWKHLPERMCVLLFQPFSFSLSPVFVRTACVPCVYWRTASPQCSGRLVAPAAHHFLSDFLRSEAVSTVWDTQAASKHILMLTAACQFNECQDTHRVWNRIQGERSLYSKLLLPGSWREITSSSPNRICRSVRYQSLCLTHAFLPAGGEQQFFKCSQNRKKRVKRIHHIECVKVKDEIQKVVEFVKRNIREWKNGFSFHV